MKKILIVISGLMFMVVIYSCTFINPYTSLAYDFSEDTDSTSTDATVDDTSDFGEIAQQNGTMYMRGEKLDGDIFQLSISAKDMTIPVLGIAFHLAYEKEKLAFLKYDPGNFLERGGDPFYLVKNDEETAEIVFGETLRRDDSFPIGGEVVTNIYFQILGGDKFSFEFKKGIVSTLDSIRQDIDQIAWENFAFDKNAQAIDDESYGDASVLASGQSEWSFVWTAVVIIFSAIPVAYLIISFIKKHGGMKKIIAIS